MPAASKTPVFGDHKVQDVASQGGFAAVLVRCGMMSASNAALAKGGQDSIPSQGIQAAFRNGPYSTLAFGSADANSLARVSLSSAR